MEEDKQPSVTSETHETPALETADKATGQAPATPAAADPEDPATQALRKKVVEVIRTCFDPEIPVNIYDLGLIYEINIEPSSAVRVKMTLTSPGCPSVFSLPGEVEDKIRRLGSFKDVQVEVVWDPPWNPGKMSEAAKLQLGMM